VLGGFVVMTGASLNWGCFMDFRMGIIFGLLLGTNIGVILVGLLFSLKHRDYADAVQPPAPNWLITQMVVSTD
jgi:hypothetical protein